VYQKIFLLCNQLVLPIMDYDFFTWTSVARTEVWKLQVLQFTCFCNAITVPYYVSDKIQRGHGGCVFHGPHQSTILEIGLIVSFCADPVTSANKTLVLTTVCHQRTKPQATGNEQIIEAARKVNTSLQEMSLSLFFYRTYVFN
jgi:hypothetical protein